jgi:hypothetical protein
MVINFEMLLCIVWIGSKWFNWTQTHFLICKWENVVPSFFFFFFFFPVFRDRVSLCSSGCPGTHFVDQTGLELRNPPASASQVLRSKAWGTTAWWLSPLYYLTRKLKEKDKENKWKAWVMGEKWYWTIYFQ